MSSDSPKKSPGKLALSSTGQLVADILMSSGGGGERIIREGRTGEGGVEGA